jgi:hypothetical protein
MSRNCNDRRSRQQRQLAQHVHSVDANHFFNLLTSEQLLQIVEEQLPEHRERRYPPTVTLAMFLGQVMSADGSCQNAVNQAIVHRLLSGMDPGSVNTGGYCIARQRLPQQMVCTLGRQSGALLSAHTPQKWLWRGRPVKLVDGTTVSMPDTPQNQERFPQHAAAEPGAGFPLARLVGVISLSHGAVLDAAIGPYKGKGNGEHGLLRQLLECFVPGDVILADAYFTSYFLIAELRARGVDVLFEQHGGRGRSTDFRLGEKLGARDHVVKWRKPKKRPAWMSAEEYQAYPQEMAVREVKVGKKVLVSTLLNARKAPKGALGELFGQRWNVELDLRNIKTTLGMERLSCLTPQMCEKEVWVYLLAYNLIRLLMAQAAVQAELLPRQLSFKHTLQIWVAWSQRQFLSTAAEDTATLFTLIAQIRVGHRPGRLEPRAVKTRPKTFPRLNKSRWQARAEIRRYGHLQKLN